MKKKPYSFDKAQDDALKDGPTPTPVRIDYELVDWVTEHMLTHPDEKPPSGKLSNMERLRREDAVRFANASMYLSGFETVSEEFQAKAQKFIDGEIDVEDLGPTPKPKAQATLEEIMSFTESPDFSENFQRAIANDRLKEQAFRQKIVDQVNASNALEGYTPDAHLVELQRRFIALEIGTAEMLESVREFAQQMQKLYPAPPPSLSEEDV